MVPASASRESSEPGVELIDESWTSVTARLPLVDATPGMFAIVATASESIGASPREIRRSPPPGGLPEPSLAAEGGWVTVTSVATP
jgi:hypothetical protein